MRVVLDDINSKIGIIGASQSRISIALQNSQVIGLNSSAAEGRIRDVDVAAESAELSRLGILQQGAASILAQANSIPRLALTLLSGQG